MSNTDDFAIENGVLTKYVGPGGDVVVPDHVTNIGMDAFMNNKTITSIRVPSGVSIHPNAFAGCKGLADKEGMVIVQNRVYDCFGSKKTLAIPDGVKEIMPNAFSKQKKVSQIILPDSVTKLWGNCFGNTNTWSVGFRLSADYPNLTKVVMPDALVKSLGLTGLKQNFDLASLLLSLLRNPTNYSGELKAKLVSVIQKGHEEAANAIIREDDTGLMSNYLALQKNVSAKEIDQYLLKTEQTQSGAAMRAFLLDYKAHYLDSKKPKQEENERTDLDLGVQPKTPNEWREILRFSVKNGEITISEYKGTENTLVIPKTIGKNTVTAIADEAFSKGNGWRIEELQLPDTIKNIGKQAFFKGNISTITLPDSLLSIGADALGNCRKLETISLPINLKVVSVRMFKGCDSLKSVVINESLEIIDGAAFSGCCALKTIVLPKSVSKVENWAFAECTELASVTIPNPDAVIEDKAFFNCPKLTIHAPAGSYAEQYAKEHDIPFVAE